MTFKHDWEKTPIPAEFSAVQIGQMISQAFPNQHITSYEVISGGCANLNIKFFLNDMIEPYILRIYMREQQAADVERNLSLRLQSFLPIPKSHYVGHLDEYKFAVTQYMPGITLRDHLLSKDAVGIEELMLEVGLMLAKLATVQFDRPGFLNADLSIKVPHNPEDLLSFVQDCLQNITVVHQLGDEFCIQLTHIFEHNFDLVPDLNEHHLVHGDYDPANILVRKIQGKWQVSGILDWEFAFSGSVLWDVANMLRYGHHMPPHYETWFLDGLKKGEVHLPSDWRDRVAILNISGLLDCLVRSNLHDHPRRCRDICELIHHFYAQLVK